MPLDDDPDAGPDGTGQAGEAPDGQVHSQLVEALILLLIEKGVLTRSDALSIVQTVAQVQRGDAVEGSKPAPETRAALDLLQRLHLSFEALAERPVARGGGEGDNVHQLRPPIHGGRSEFLRDD
jgi:hypothetical protein